MNHLLNLFIKHTNNIKPPEYIPRFSHEELALLNIALEHRTHTQTNLVWALPFTVLHFDAMR